MIATKWVSIGRRWRRLLPALAAAVLITGCVSTPDATDGQLGRSDKFVVVRAQAGDTAHSLAGRYLGDASKFWMIEDANPSGGIRPGQVVVVPLHDWNALGVGVAGYQTVPILAYHRIGPHPSAMTMETSDFRRQMFYLRDNGYRVISLADLQQYLEGGRQLPAKAVVITFDDGHRSVYDIAFPLLRELGFPATFFVYTDYIGNGGVDPAQLKEMSDSGLITVLPHSKTHSNLAARMPGEGEAEYRKRLDREISQSRRSLEKIVDTPMFGYAYPYGDTNPDVMAMLERDGYAVGVTVQKGGNAAFAPQLLLRRTMIFGDRDMDAFVASLDTYRSLGPTGAK
jgi:peptidoglycan/xylan/chitin deacetylase (PgdA/CDA1 family)